MLLAANMQGTQAQNHAPSNWWVLLAMVVVVALLIAFAWTRSRATRGPAESPGSEPDTTGRRATDDRT